MFPSLLFLLGTATSFGLGSALGHDKLVCETSDASPSLEHINYLIDNLRDNCDDDVCFGSKLGGKSKLCGDTVKAFSGDGDAVLMLCAGDFDPHAGMDDYCRFNKPGKIKCGQGCEEYTPDDIADLLEELSEECSDSERAGGIYNLPDGGELKLFSK